MCKMICNYQDLSLWKAPQPVITCRAKCLSGTNEVIFVTNHYGQDTVLGVVGTWAMFACLVYYILYEFTISSKVGIEAGIV